LAAPLVAQKLLGATGEYSMLFLILMAVMSTGSAEVIAVASLIIYDIYQVVTISNSFLFSQILLN
jgi:Na+/proline symporter